MKKAFVAIVVLAFVGVLALLVHHLVADKHVIVASLTDEVGNEVLVTEETSGLFEWEIQLCWRKGKGPWMTYLLDGDAYFWRNVELSKSTNSFLVKRQQQIIGQLNTEDGSFNYPVQKLLVHRPKNIVVSDDPFDITNRIYPESPKWNSVWPSAMLNYK